MIFRDTTEIEKIREAYHRCDEPGEVLIEKAYEAGLRRAQELAKELSYVWYRNHDVQKYVVVQLDSLNQAIDAEAAKERT